MKQTLKISVSLLLALAALLCLMACSRGSAEGLWENATYRKDATVGEGSKEVKVDVVIGEEFITLTVKTDEELLGNALYKEGLINDADFFDTVNGVKADWNADKAYWGFYKGDEYMLVGVNQTSISGGEHYRLVYTK